MLPICLRQRLRPSHFLVSFPLSIFSSRDLSPSCCYRSVLLLLHVDGVSVSGVHCACTQSPPQITSHACHESICKCTVSSMKLNWTLCICAELLQTRALLLHWLPWVLLMHRPGFTLTRSSLPNLFSTGKPGSSSDPMTRSMSVSSRNSRTDLRNNSLMKSPELETRVDNCLKNLALSDSNPLTVGQTAQLLLIERIYTELKVTDY